MADNTIIVRKTAIGKIDLTSGLVDITDPCYSSTIWCRMNKVKVKPGMYHTQIWKDTKSGRVAIIGISLVHGSRYTQEQLEEIGRIGVDAGVAGFWPAGKKPDYSDKEWGQLCERCLCKKENTNRKYYEFDEGFCADSGWGDGEYSVYAYKNSRKQITAIEIHCL